MTKYIIRGRGQGGGGGGGGGELRRLSTAASSAALASGTVFLRDASVQTFYVDSPNGLSHGAHGNGTTNDSDHIQAAFLAAHNYSANGAPSKVLFTSGKTYYVNTSWNMPTIRTNDWLGQTNPTHQRRGMVTLSGYGATIKYNTVVPPATKTEAFCWLQTAYPSGQYVTYGNLIVEGFTIDDNYRRPNINSASIMRAVGESNFDNITFRDIYVPRHFPYRTNKDDWQTIGGIQLYTYADVIGVQAHWSYVRNINIINCEINSMIKSIDILVPDNPYGSLETGPWGQVPILYENILVEGGYANNNKYCGSNAHLVQCGSGRNITFRNWTGYDCADDSIEINNTNEVLIENCHFEENRQSICYTCFGLPMDPTTPNITIRGCTYSGKCGPYWPPSWRDPNNNYPVSEPVAPMIPEVRGYVGGTGAAIPKNRSWGNFLMEDCDYEYGIDNAYVGSNIPFMIGSNTIPMESVTIRNCKITDAQSSSTTPMIYVKQGPQMGRTLPVNIQNVTWRNSRSNSYVKLSKPQVLLYGAYSLTTDIPGF